MISMMIRIYNVTLCKIWTGRIVTSEIAFRELNMVIRTEYIAPPAAPPTNIRCSFCYHQSS